MSENVETSVNPKETETINSQSGQSENNNTNNNALVFKSAKIALPTMIDEYTKERERAGIIDTKAVSLITMLLALFTIYMPITPFDKIKSIYLTGTKNQLIVITIAVLIFLVSSLIAFFLFYTLINIVKLREYKRVDIDLLTKDEFLQCDEHIYEKSLCKHYLIITTENSNNNDMKSKKINLCYKLTIISFILLLISCLLIKII
ncbi:MAG: hypothetical protein ACRC6T_05390 [Sarcina sp.]